MLAVIDCGTSNTRVYIVGKNGDLFGMGTRPVGVRDVVASGSHEVLKTGLLEAFDDALRKAGKTPDDVEFCLASGMITSELGLLELPHLTAPIGIEDLARHVCIQCKQEILPIAAPVMFIRGIKNHVAHQPTLADLRCLDFMRGEEVQVMGVLAALRPLLPLSVIILSSHTKIVHVNVDGEITASITSVSGQFYQSLAQSSIASSLASSEESIPFAYNVEEIIETAYQAVMNAGLLRAMLMPRFMQNLLATNVQERRLFVEAAIAADDMRIFDEFTRLGTAMDTDFILIGQHDRCQLYERFIRKRVNTNTTVTCISDVRDIAQLTIKGALAVFTKWKSTH